MTNDRETAKHAKDTECFRMGNFCRKRVQRTQGGIHGLRDRDVDKVDADEAGLGGDDAADALRYEATGVCSGGFPPIPKNLSLGNG